MQDSPLDARRARRAFDQAADTYATAAVLHTEVRTEMLKRLELTELLPEVIVDVGCGTGEAARALKARYPRAQVIALDFSLPMLKKARLQQRLFKRFLPLCADAERLPFAAASVDLLFGNLSLPWCEPDAALREFRRVLRPSGLLAASSFGPDTLKELRQAYRELDGDEHVHGFIDMHDLGDALSRAGFASPVLDVDRFTLKYDKLAGLLQDLKALGATNALKSRPRGLSTPRRLARLEKAYELHRSEGRVGASCEIVFAHAWAPEVSKPRERPNDRVISLSEVKQQLKQRR